MPGRELAKSCVAEFVLGAPPGTIVALGGLDGQTLRGLLAEIEPARHQRVALFAPIIWQSTTTAVVEQVLNLLAETARRLWPIWFTDVSFDGCRNDTLGRLAVGAIARSVAGQIAELSSSWTEEAARLVLDGRLPRVIGTPPAVEFGNLSRAISRTGLVIVADAGAALRTASNPAAAVRALEWMAQVAHVSVAALFAELPPTEPPFEHLLYGARDVMPDAVPAFADSNLPVINGEPWIAPWRGRPHPLSEIERRLAQAIVADAELAPFFAFNQIIETVRGSRPRVDLAWTAGRLVVEVDGYDSHGSRTAFMNDRHRDYELILSGFTVLRLANDEIAQDYGKAIEKIRALVRLQKARIDEES